MLRLENVRKSYLEANGHQLPVLDIPSFHVGPGEQMALIGRSGCGKSTLLHVIAGISRPDTGQVMIDGLDTTRLPEAGSDRFRAEKIGYVFQTFKLLPAFTAFENVLLGMTFARHRADRKRAAQLLDQVGLSKRASHKPGAMSVGEQQRVAVARALANRPRLLLADEPTANVDPSNQQHIIDLIRNSCQQEEIALILVTHSMEVANQLGRVDRLEEINQVGAAA
ncbi:MAG: ABC transporter ATP-binding protein [Planctomycetales bacterium]|nr:ABC transporter ATP-binding protein [Planctomycetales bacterium]